MYLLQGSLTLDSFISIMLMKMISTEGAHDVPYGMSVENKILEKYYYTGFNNVH